MSTKGYFPSTMSPSFHYLTLLDYFTQFNAFQLMFTKIIFYIYTSQTQNTLKQNNVLEEGGIKFHCKDNWYDRIVDILKLNCVLKKKKKKGDECLRCHW